MYYENLLGYNKNIQEITSKITSNMAEFDSSCILENFNDNFDFLVEKIKEVY